VHENKLGGPRLLSLGARRCPRLICRGAMHATISESKTMSSWDKPSSTIYLFKDASTRDVLLELLFFRGVQRRLRCGAPPSFSLTMSKAVIAAPVGPVSCDE
jgi:hypothetical protein